MTHWTLDQIDAALAEWQTELDHAGANLLELDDLFTCKRLKGNAGNALTGRTRDQALPALAALDHLWQSLSLLTDNLHRAQSLRKSVSRLWPSEHTLRGIEHLLTEESIPLPAVRAPLEQRELLSASETIVSISPQHLLTTMNAAFGAAKETILAVDTAWNRLEPLLAEDGKEAAALQELAAALGEAVPTDLAAAQHKIHVLSGRIAADPLGVQTDFSLEIAPLLKRARAWLDEAARQRDLAAADQANAHRRLSELEEIQRACASAYAECRAKIADPPGVTAPLEAQTLADLSAWLAALDNTHRQGRWKAARIGLERWLPQAEQALNRERAALASNQAPLESWAEMRGYLNSLRVKERAQAAQGQAVDPNAAALAQAADRLLKDPPVPLDEVSRLVSQYEALLRSRTK